MNEAKPEPQSNQPRVHSLLEDLRPILSDVTKASIRGVGIHGCALRASVAKCFEFAALVHRDPWPEHGFFITSTLRGICEDLIVLTFVAPLSPDERNEAVSLLMAKNVADGIAAQSAFFKSMRPWQPVLRPLLETSTDTGKRLRMLAKTLGWAGKQPWPTVWFMAKASSLAPLYSYIYAATSKWVHFSPHILLRMGWGGKSDDVGDETEWTFTTSNFAQYYAEFNQVYSLMLLLHLVRGPAESIVPAEAASTIAALKSCLDSPLRWPEDVTFEEMNLKSPGSLQRILLRAAHDIGSLGPS
jgi:hypothetical protein